MHFQFGSRQLDLSCPRVMGILNVTPDSFFDGGEYYRVGDDISAALARAELMVADGADFIDVGGESTRPGAESVTLQEELDRVIPVVEALAKNVDVIISVDTSTPAVMREAAKLGAGLINDVRALQRSDAVKAVSESGLPVCLMHMQGKPSTMQANPDYEDVVSEVASFFAVRMKECVDAGINGHKIILDPGFGFGKSDSHNIALLKNMRAFQAGQYPVLAGLSRKSMIGRLLGRSESERLAGSLALAQYALHYGANILRVHDIKETADVVKLFQLVEMNAL